MLSKAATCPNSLCHAILCIRGTLSKPIDDFIDSDHTSEIKIVENVHVNVQKKTSKFPPIKYSIAYRSIPWERNGCTIDYFFFFKLLTNAVSSLVKEFKDKDDSLM